MPPLSPINQRLSQLPRQATPIATKLQHLSQSSFARPAEQVTPGLIGCLLVKHQPDGEPLRLA
ncbi:hypothetical protein [Synechococcus sp. CBW1108]|uniref:hypothetical protein n=1 Tax=Synechococcus sp. CBW1108 TaxID=1353147 RepID=UPI0018CFD642|nr:hypothetical protein [Synechococcus sp. CBW1108]QPN70074.1 hypothetical protein H8F27_16890 [Synechococcus sp. CBW1108]